MWKYQLHGSAQLIYGTVLDSQNALKTLSAGVGDERTESHKVVQPLRLSLWSTQYAVCMLLLLDELMSCVAGTNGCLDLRCRAFAPNGRVRAGAGI